MSQPRKKTTRTLSHRGKLLLLLGLVSVLVSIFEIQRNAWYRLFQKAEGTVLWEKAPLSAKLGSEFFSAIPQDERKPFRQLTLTVPFAEAPDGCEFLYAAIVESYPKEVPPGRILYAPETRRLVRFLYDYKNLRCESKDLSLPGAQGLHGIEIQLIDVRLLPDAVLEVARTEGLKIEFRDDSHAEAKPFRFEKENALLPLRREWPRMNLRSLDLKDSEVEVRVGPIENFPKLIRRELERRIQACQVDHHCSPIFAAVTNVYEEDVLALFAKAEAVGIPVELIVNAHGMIRFPGQHQAAPYSPWMWMNGNRERATFKGFLQMHTKFVVFGEDLVISSNSNLSILDEFSSRGISLEYRNPEVVKMFQAVHGMIRTGVFFPVEVDRRKSFSLLLNSERPKRFVSAARRAVAGIRTEEGVATSAYGVVLDEFSRNPGLLRLSMTPIFDACFVYERRLCLKEELLSRATSGKLKLGVTAYHYLEGEDPEEKDSSHLWAEEGRAEGRVKELEWKSGKSLAEDLYKNHPQAIDIYAGYSWDNPVHHERIALLEPDLLMSGSANFVYPFSLNTVELLRIPKVFKRVSEEMSTYDEPYIILDRESDPRAERPQVPGCIFALEHPLGKPFSKTKKHFSRTSLLQALEGQGIRQTPEKLRLKVLPESWWRAPYEKSPIEEEQITEKIESWSSFFCVLDTGTGKHSIISIPAEPF